MPFSLSDTCALPAASLRANARCRASRTRDTPSCPGMQQSTASGLPLLAYYCLTASGTRRDSCLGCLSLEITHHATAPQAKRRNLRFLCPARFHNEALSGTLPRHAAAPKQMKKGRQYQSKHNLQGAGDFFPLLITTRTLLRFHRTQPAPRLIHNVSLNSSEPTPP